ncbi:MAG TPA: hypothetical protein VFT95_14590, partial [Micromonosporaceae bacterium]|nr:hypothetical protein [Micromonosporaceae bacterium]
DSNLLIPIQRLRDGVPWKGPPGKHAMHDADRDRITFLGKKVGVTFTGKDGAPTPAELEEMMTKLGNRTPVAVLAETPAVTGTDRGASMVVDRNSVDYQLALREMATGDRNQQVGTDVGGADRLAVADILFADRAPGAAPPVFYTDDERVMRPLLERWGVAGTYTQVGQHMKKGEKQGSWAERFAAANPNGFEIVIRGRRMRVVLVR